ncbi:DNA-directed RNA polymerase subunit beta', partial [Candidatus Peregrinibacteria bacterium]|nr:DNA-directed RNA polymerase subunit beta' [Candidatus Peregrinibacteria bacterium]
TMRTFHMGGVAEGADITQGLTRVEELFEARLPKSPAVLAEISGKVSVKHKKEGIEIGIAAEELGEDHYRINPEYEIVVKKGDTLHPKQIIARSRNDKQTVKARETGKVTEVKNGVITVKHAEKLAKVYNFGPRERILVQNGDLVAKGQPLNRGHLNLQDLMTMTGVYTTQRYIMTEVQHIYASQGQTINDKHIEIIVKQMLSKVRVTSPGDTEFLPGEVVNIGRFDRANAAMRKKKKKESHADRLLLGISRVAITTESWLSAASFQETIRVLVEASTTKKIDNLKGLKENVIIGKLIPAGQIFRDQQAKSKK